MLIIEGCDMVGKTTLVDELKRILARSGFHFERRGLAEAQWSAKEWLDGIKAETVCDRGHMSEVVYGLNLRGKCNITPIQYAHLDMKVRQQGGFTAVITATPEAYAQLVEMHYDPAREAFSREQCEQVNRSYLDFLDARLGEDGCRYTPDSVEFVWRIDVNPDGTLNRPGPAWARMLAERYVAMQSRRS